MFKRNFCSEIKPMEQEPIIKLPFWETLRRSFLYAFSNLDVFIRISSFWLLLMVFEALTDYPALCTLNEDVCRDDWRENISVLVMALASVAISVAYYQQIILRKKYSYFSFSFGRREITYLGYGLILILIIAIPTAVLAFVIIVIFSLVSVPDGIIPSVIIIPFAVTLICSRFFIILPAVAVGNHQLTLKRAFLLTKGNANKIFWGQTLMMIPIMLGIAVLSVLYNYFEVENTILKFIVVAGLMLLSYFDTCLKSSFFGHVYQYFMYFDKKRQEEKAE